jgi:acetate kinase
MNGRESCVLTINAGSSSIKFAVYRVGSVPEEVLVGKVDRIGLSGTRIEVLFEGTKFPQRRPFPAPDRHQAVARLVDWIELQPSIGSVTAVGHRVVHGMNHTQPERITPALLAKLRKTVPFAPEHLPIEIELMDAFRERCPSVPQVACFDTSFHRTMPRVAKVLPIPRRYTGHGVERYGFHGLAYQHLMDELRRLGDKSASKGRVILAHLGNGASMAAVLNGRSVDTTMGLTPAGGLVMGTRTGDLDPGVLLFLIRNWRLPPGKLARMVNHESGLLGVSGSSPDMRDLLRRESRDPRAAEAVELFCQEARKWVGSLAAVLGGVDTLVFSGGIGENSPVVRARICSGLGFLGIRLNPRKNVTNAPLISPPSSRLRVRVIKADEEAVIAKSVILKLRLAPGRRKKP